MNKLIISLSLLTLLSCGNKNDDGGMDTDMITNSESANGASKDELPEIKFTEEVFDFGKITQGEKVSHSFTFTNIGKKNLIISGASGSCGCTVPEWPKEPIKPGQQGVIDVVFSSEGKSGMQEKTVTVVTNCEPATRVIRIKTEIIVPEEMPK
ncbi:DUF1573 domain-containing protein [Aurantibacillus circumpalustris]|uniref:DUF1573 domain-containing protein n=1 Tax=Aurantibacillus circumpalustris TaxID=3036359 RepID=UPI00295C2EE8|nr:DUF1573 domain-containing protein [Aurantibacillus circumpalustris]